CLKCYTPMAGSIWRTPRVRITQRHRSGISTEPENTVRPRCYSFPQSARSIPAAASNPQSSDPLHLLSVLAVRATVLFAGLLGENGPARRLSKKVRTAFGNLR